MVKVTLSRKKKIDPEPAQSLFIYHLRPRHQT